MRRPLAPPALALVALLGAAPAAAKPPAAAPAKPARDATAADLLFKDGRAAMAKEDFATACSKFQASLDLDPAVGTLFNLADCEEHRGKLATAWQLFLEVMRKVAPADDRYPIAKKRASDLEAKVAMLTVKLASDAPEGTTVRRDDQPLKPGEIGAPIAVDAGAHTIVVWAPGHASRTVEVSLDEAEKKEITVAPYPVGESDATTSSRDTRRAVGLVLTAVGGSAILAGFVTGGMTAAKKSEADKNCPNKACNAAGLAAVSSGRSLGAASVATFIIGGAATATGVILLLTSGGGADKKSDTALVPVIGPGVVGAWLTRRF